MKRFINVAYKLWCEPCAILPEMHRQICNIVQAHIDGMAHNPDGVAQIYTDAQKEQMPKYQVVDGIAIVPIQGVLDNKVSQTMRMSGAMGLDDIEHMLVQAIEDDEVEGIMLDVDSPGGSVTGIPELAKKIRATKAQKPVAAFTDSIAASAAYWLMAPADVIYASESAKVGSIGVYMAWLDTSRQFEMEGLRTEIIKVGKWKAMGLPGTSLTDDERALLQASVDKVAAWFKGFVVSARGGVDSDTMQGQVFFADEAVANNLIDKVGSVDDAMAELRALIEARR